MILAGNPEGTLTTQVLGPDPQWGMQAPVTSLMTMAMPSGLTSTTLFARHDAFADPASPMSLADRTDVLSVNNRAYTTTFTTGTLSYASTSPAGRASTRVINAIGQVTQSQVGNLNAVSFAYDANGRLSATTQGTRAAGFAYGSDGRLSTVTDPLGRQTNFVYDAAGRLTFGGGVEVGRL